jgi:hypothetical protein
MHFFVTRFYGHVPSLEVMNVRERRKTMGGGRTNEISTRLWLDTVYPFCLVFNVLLLVTRQKARDSLVTL